MSSSAKPGQLEFLADRSCFIVVTAEGERHSGQYIKSHNVTFLGRGTGVLIEHNGRGYVATCEHVVRAHKDRLALGTRVHVSLERGKRSWDIHDGYAFAPRRYRSDSEGYACLNDENHPIPEDPATDTDLALIRLSIEAHKAAKRDGRKFVKWGSVSHSLPANSTEVIFRGYPQNNAHWLEDQGCFVADGFALSTRVIQTSGNRITIDATEEGVLSGKGKIELQRELKGISGAGLFDSANKLIGVINGGNPKGRTIFACAASKLEPLFAELS